ncbi:MAG: DUF5723 family protein [Balneolaceae bacterium]
MNRKIFLLLSIWILLLQTDDLQGQQILSGSAMGAGGAGTVVGGGHESIFTNPANLIDGYPGSDRDRRTVSLMAGGIQFDSPAPIGSAGDLQTVLNEWIRGYVPGGSARYPLEAEDHLSRNFPHPSNPSAHQIRGEWHWLGLQWDRGTRSYAIGLRSRFANRITSGRGLYDNTPVQVDGIWTVDRSSTTYFHALHELSFGFAEPVTFLNGILPGLSQFVIGIAPKLVVGGSYQSTAWSDRFTRPDPTTSWTRTRSLTSYTTGPFSRQHEQYLSGGSHIPERSELFGQGGWGAGLDVGLNWVTPLGRDFSWIESGNAPPSTLQISVSFLDIGMIYYRDHPVQRRIDEWTVSPDSPPAPAEQIFMGRPGEQLPFHLDQGTDLLDGSITESSNLLVLLPSTIQTGVAWRHHEWTVSSDLALGLTDDAFNSDRLLGFLGVEYRIRPEIPLRMATRLSHHQHDYLAIGTGWMGEQLEFSITVQLRSHWGIPSRELNGWSVGALRWTFPTSR